jgi:hypothetical protein
MVRRLTQEDIDRFGLIDAVAGDIATPEDLQKMMLPTLPKQEVLETYTVDPEIEEIKNQALNVVNQPVPVNNQPPVDQNIVQQNVTAGNKQLLDLLALMQEPQVPVDPFENLSKNQRRMLAFAGIRDAGLALQGKEGSSVANLMNQFTERADIERKRKAALAQRQMLGTFLSGSAAGTLDPQSIINAMALGALPPEAGNAMLAQMEKAKQKQVGDITTATGAFTVLDTVEDLMKKISENPTMITGPVGMILGMMPFTKAGEARLTTQTLKANLAFDALRAIKASGATLGSVSAPELALLEAKVANLDLNRSPEAIMASLQEIDRYYKQLVINAYQMSDDPSQLDAIFGGRPEWANGPTATLPEYTFENVPLGELVVDREGGNKVYKFLGGDRNNRSNWQEVNF